MTEEKKNEISFKEICEKLEKHMQKGKYHAILYVSKTDMTAQYLDAALTMGWELVCYTARQFDKDVYIFRKVE